MCATAGVRTDRLLEGGQEGIQLLETLPAAFWGHEGDLISKA